MDEANKPIGVVVLAAGASVRMKRPKQLLIFKGKTLLRRAAENALASDCDKVCAVLGANFEMLRDELADLEIEVAVNENWQKGMSSSLKYGLEKLLASEPNLCAVLVVLIDQPLIDASIINRLVSAFRKTNKKILAAEYADTIGVPAIFSRSLFEEILNLSAESGAKRIIEKHAGAVEKIPVPEAAFDVDTREDFENLLRLGQESEL